MKEAKGVLCDGDEYYISTNNMYITQMHYSAAGDESTEIFRFAFRDGVIRGAAVGTVPGYVKDSFCLDDAWVKERFVRRAAGKELSLIEGVMGYFDGLGGASLRASAWDVGRITQTPVILVVDARGASLSLAAQVKGFLDFVPDGRIQGVIFNRMNPMLGRRMAPELEKLGVRLLGCVQEELSLIHI